MSVGDEDSGGWAPALHFCPHVEESVAELPSVLPAPESQCSTPGCSIKNKEMWVCLKCYKTFCGRYANGCMLKHKDAECDHCIALGYGDLSFWCYKCDNYLHYMKIRKVFEVYARFHIEKFGEETVASFESQYVREMKAELQSIGDDDGLDDEDLKTSEEDSPEALDKNDWEAVGIASRDLDNPTVDRILGAIYGTALGDAVGLCTEFMSKAEVHEVFGDRPIPFPDFPRNSHSKRFTRGDWTDDTDQMILILDTLLECGGVDEKNFAAKLHNWMHKGFPELGDTSGMGIGTTTHAVITHDKFLTHPCQAARDVWERQGRNGAANGAVMRTSILGCFDFFDINNVASNASRLCQVTHADSRCIASSVAISSLIALLIQGRLCTSNDDVQSLLSDVSKCVDHNVKFDNDACRSMFAEHLSAVDFRSIALDDAARIGYTLKCMACGVVALGRDDFRRTIQELAKEGGDADTNGAVCGAVLGAKLGYKRLPRTWVNSLCHKKWLHERVARFLKSDVLRPAEGRQGAE